MNTILMPSGLPRGKSAPALLLYLPPNDGSQSGLDQSCLPRSWSAPPVTAATGDCLPCRKQSNRDNMGEKENQRLAIDDLTSSFTRSPTETATNPAGNNTSGINRNHQLQNPHPILRRSSARNRAIRRNYSNDVYLNQQPPSFVKDLAKSPAKKPEWVSSNDESSSARSSLISKRLSSGCLQTLRRLRPSLALPSDYHLSTDRDDRGSSDRPNSSIPSPTLTITAASNDPIPMDRNEVHLRLTSPESCVEALPRSSEKILGESLDCHSALQEQKDDDNTHQRASLEVTKDPFEAPPSHREGNDFYMAIDCVTTDNPTRPKVSTKDSLSDVELNEYGKSQRDHEDEKYQFKSKEAQLTEDTGTYTNLQETLKESKINRLILDDSRNTEIGKPNSETSNFFEKKSERTSKRSRLSIWRHGKPDTPDSPKTGFRNWLGKRKNEAAATSQASENINKETLKLKRSPSLLFRLLNSVAPEPAPERQAQNSEDISTTTRKTPPHPLKEHYATASKVKKEQELHEAKELAFFGVAKNNIMDKGSRRVDVEAWKILQLGDRFVDDAPGMNIVAGRRWEAEKFRDLRKGLGQGIEEDEITIEGFTGSRRFRRCYPMLSPGDLRTTCLSPISLKSAKPTGLIWNGSIQEYAGSLGHVCPSGERPVNDTFRRIDLSRSGCTTSRIHNLASLKKTGFGEEPEFEDSGLAADWDVAMRMMDEFSKAERKLKRAGAIKHRLGGLGGGFVGSTASEKDGIGRSFSNDERVMSVILDAPTGFPELKLEDYGDSENESAMGEAPCTISANTIYESPERPYSFEE